MKKLALIVVALTGILISQKVFAVEFISWENLVPGQKGYGLTVFQGATPEKFEVEFVGTAPHPLLSKEKIILVRMGKPLEKSEVLAGMSGSPVYFEHQGKWKLAGALGFGYGSFSSDKALGGITPINLMLNQEKALGLIKVAKKLKTRKDLIDGMIYLGEQNNFNVYMLQPRIEIISSKNSAGQKNKPFEVIAPKPGEAVTVVLIDGDVTIGATGTVTYVEGNKFLAFGHPFLGDGKVLMPAYKAEIAASFKSPANGFKITASKKECIGYVSYDNLFAIEGTVQPLPEDSMLPINLTINIRENSKDKQFRFQFQVLKHKIYTEVLMGMAGEELLTGLWDAKNKATVVSSSIINFHNHQPIQLFNASASGDITKIGPFLVTNGPWSAVDQAAATISYIMDSEWGLGIKNAAININLTAGDKILILDAYKVIGANGSPIDETRLGDTFQLVLGLRNFYGTEQYLASAPISLPKKLRFKKKYGSDYYEIRVYIESGNNFRERDENKLLDHKPDNREEFMQTILVNQKDPKKLYIQVVFPDEQTKTVKSADLIVIQEKWKRVENLGLLRSAKNRERKVILLELDPPLPGHVLDVKENFTLRLVK